MKFKAKLIDVTIVFLVLYFFFSLVEIYNYMALYKDQVEFPLMAPPKNITSDFCWDLVKRTSELTSLINFFQFNAFMAPLIIVLLIIRRRKEGIANRKQV
jgi:hypothetical protein